MPDQEQYKELSAVWKAQIDKQRVRERFDLNDNDLSGFYDANFEDNEALEIERKKTRNMMKLGDEASDYYSREGEGEGEGAEGESSR